MAEVLLVNPRKRRRRPARRRAAARRPAARRRAAPKRRRRRNPIGPFARSGMGMYVANPRRRKRRAKKRVTRSRRRARYSRNPLTIRSAMRTLVMPAATAGAGALVLDMLWGYVPIPEAIKVGPMRHVAKGLGAVVMGAIVGKVANRKMGDTMALGALTVTFHAAFRELAAQYAPGVTLGYYSAGTNAGYDPQLGMYVASPKMVTSGGESHASPNSELGYYVQEGVGANY